MEKYDPSAKVCFLPPFPEFKDAYFLTKTNSKIKAHGVLAEKHDFFMFLFCCTKK